jgi:two-component system response regulator AtoC
VRDLKNVVEQAAVLQESSTLTLDMLPEHIRKPQNYEVDPFDWLDSNISIKQAQKRIEQILIRRVLKQTDGNRSAAARMLEISHRALLYKMKEYGIA